MGNRDRAGGRLARSIRNRSAGPFPKALANAGIESLVGPHKQVSAAARNAAWLGLSA
jgi:hypothetical protein